MTKAKGYVQTKLEVHAFFISNTIFNSASVLLHFLMTSVSDVA